MVLIGPALRILQTNGLSEHPWFFVLNNTPAEPIGGFVRSLNDSNSFAFSP